MRNHRRQPRRRTTCFPIAVAFGLVGTAPMSLADGLRPGDQLLDLSVMYGAAAGTVASAFDLEAGLGVGMRYSYELTPRFALGASVGSHRFDTSRSRRESTFVENTDSQARVLTAGLHARVTFNPDDRLRAYAVFGRTFHWIELEESFSFREGSFENDGAVTSKATTWQGDVELGGEMAITDAFLVRASLGFGQFAANFVEPRLSVGVGYRFRR